MCNETEAHWAIMYVMGSPIFGGEELRFYWFLSEEEARIEFKQVADKHPDDVLLLVTKTGDTITLAEIHGPRWDYEGRPQHRKIVDA